MKLNGAVGQIARQITGSVQRYGAFLRMHPGYELFSSKLRTIKVTLCQANAAKPNFTNFTSGYELADLVKNHNVSPSNRLTNTG